MDATRGDAGCHKRRISRLTQLTCPHGAFSTAPALVMRVREAGQIGRPTLKLEQSSLPSKHSYFHHSKELAQLLRGIR